MGTFPPPNTAAGECCACPLLVTAASIELQSAPPGVPVDTTSGRDYEATLAYEKVGCPTSGGVGYSPPQSFLNEGLRGRWSLSGGQFMIIPNGVNNFSNAALRADSLTARVAGDFGSGYVVTFTGVFLKNRP
ncbi:MAG: hypothetical protein HY701_05170 [Gemmatimonadetes bacterium]|nr:hypothetical protein [Gemmatimonadota bacterium]